MLKTAAPQRSSADGAAAAAIGDRLDRMPITSTHRQLTAMVGIGLLFDTFENNLSGTISICDVPVWCQWVGVSDGMSGCCVCAGGGVFGGSGG
ncbi:hypothetical protein ACWD6R_25175 [Streptomyces sp. NPDC005151]